ncbi:hypothetical protein C8F04DRAFT_1403066 [Mycena alexandri]|uniref:Uncharacterized protein n=1 Tax=Mycena alexandri TaxID=1745969 RepID=A0AAD6S500_9AGAR|nr:hypothetical protein C8F04DRAFT_1403066 [Mycena alexandri]
MDTHQRPLEIFQKTFKVVAQMDWLSYLIRVTRLIGELDPFPVLSGVASIVLLILEPLENLKRNRNLFRELAEKVVRITMRLRDEVLADKSVATSPRFIQTCTEFSDCLLSVAADLRDILWPHRKSWAGALGQYFNTYLIRDTILNAQKRVDGLIESFMLATAVGTRLRVQLIHTDLTIMRTALVPFFSNAGPEANFSDFHKLIPGDLELVPPHLHVPLTGSSESPIEYPVRVRGVRMTARLYHGEDALEWREDFHLFSSVRHDTLSAVLSLFSDGP